MMSKITQQNIKNVSDVLMKNCTNYSGRDFSQHLGHDGDWSYVFDICNKKGKVICLAFFADEIIKTLNNNGFEVYSQVTPLPENNSNYVCFLFRETTTNFFDGETMKVINFKISYAQNEQICQQGYVEVPEAVDELPEWFYYDQTGMAVPRMFTHHDGIGITQIGATEEQEAELDVFLTKVQFNDVDFVTDVILNADEDENKTYKKDDLIIKINDGAKIECEIKEPSEYRGDFVVELIPKYNRCSLKELIDYMGEYNIEFDPYCIGEDKYSIENGHLYYEISKNYFEDSQGKTDALEPVIEELQIIFQAMLFSNVEFEDDIFEQSLDSDLCEQDELFDLYLWSKGELTQKQFADRNGYEWEL